MAPTSFHHLPTEVLHLILGHLRFPGEGYSEPPDAYFCGQQQQESDQPSWYSLTLQPLVSLCLVSRRLCNIAQPILYYSFMLGYGDSWRSHLYTWDGRLASFMRTVAQRRDLAALVRRIYIHPFLLESFGEERIIQGDCEYGFVWRVDRAYPRRFISENEAQAVLRVVAHALKIEELQQLSARDLVTVLLLELPNLEHCSLQVGPYEEEIVPSAGLRAAGISHLPIKNIDVSLRAFSGEAFRGRLFYIDQRLGALLDVSPRLETLNLHMCFGFKDSSPSLPNLKNLRLTFSRLSERNLKDLLSSCRGLCSFFYEATSAPLLDRFDPDLGHDHFRLSQAVEYLDGHYKTLESLHLDLRKRGFTSYGPEPRATFKKFNALKHLFLNMDEFHTEFMAATSGDRDLLVELLPSSIVSLHLAGHITEELPRLEQSLLGLAHAVSLGQFPKLKEIRWDEKERLNDDFSVRSILATAGVKFDYDSWALSTSTLGDTQGLPQPNYINPWPTEDSDL